MKKVEIVRMFFFFYQAEQNSRLFPTCCQLLNFSRPRISKIKFQAFPGSADTLINSKIGAILHVTKLTYQWTMCTLTSGSILSTDSHWNLHIAIEDEPRIHGRLLFLLGPPEILRED